MKSLAKILLILPLLFARVVDAVTFKDEFMRAGYDYMASPNEFYVEINATLLEKYEFFGMKCLLQPYNPCMLEDGRFAFWDIAGKAFGPIFDQWWPEARSNNFYFHRIAEVGGWGGGDLSLPFSLCGSRTNNWSILIDRCAFEDLECLRACPSEGDLLVNNTFFAPDTYANLPDQFLLRNFKEKLDAAGTRPLGEVLLEAVGSRPALPEERLTIQEALDRILSTVPGGEGADAKACEAILAGSAHLQAKTSTLNDGRRNILELRFLNCEGWGEDLRFVRDTLRALPDQTFRWTDGKIPALSLKFEGCTLENLDLLGVGTSGGGTPFKDLYDIRGDGVAGLTLTDEGWAGLPHRFYASFEKGWPGRDKFLDALKDGKQIPGRFAFV